VLVVAHEQFTVRHRFAPSLWRGSTAAGRLVCRTRPCHASAGRGCARRTFPIACKIYADMAVPLPSRLFFEFTVHEAAMLALLRRRQPRYLAARTRRSLNCSERISLSGLFHAQLQYRCGTAELDGRKGPRWR
jgi:hypothetical protein